MEARGGGSFRFRELEVNPKVQKGLLELCPPPIAKPL